MNIIETDFSPLNKILEESISCIKRMGLKVMDLGPQRVTLKMPLAGNESHVGTMYAGILFTVAEIPGGALFLTTFDPFKYVPLMKQMEIKYLKAARTDVTVSAELSPEEVARMNGELEEKGKSEFVLNCEVKDMEGNIVAETVATYQVRRNQ
ncbi:YiiD C-terminal domain-containing protein [Thermodesulfobacteriota bacterium]